MKQRDQQQVEGEKPRGLIGGEEHQPVERAGDACEDGAPRSPSRRTARDRTAPAAALRNSLHVDELDRIDIGKREQERADRGEGRWHAEVADREAAKAEEADRRTAAITTMKAVKASRPRRAGAPRAAPEQKERIGVAERAPLGKEDDRVGPVHGAGEDVAPVLDDARGRDNRPRRRRTRGRSR